MTASPGGGCCWCTRTRTTSPSAPAPRWRSTPPRACRSRWSPARWASSARSSRRRWRSWPRRKKTGWGSTGSASWPPPVARSAGPAPGSPPAPARGCPGGRGRWRDWGMMGTQANGDPRCFWQADVDEAAAALLGITREVQPQVLVTYDANGCYGHPDHIQAHRVAWRAFELAGADGPGRPARFYATAAPDSAQLTTEIDATGYFEVKLAAIRAHATQITVSEPF